MVTVFALCMIPLSLTIAWSFSNTKSAKIAEDVQFIKNSLTSGNSKAALGYYQDVSFFVHERINLGGFISNFVNCIINSNVGSVF